MGSFMKSSGFFFACCLALPLTLSAQTGGQVVGPGGASTAGSPTSWQMDVQNFSTGNAAAQVTTKNPCGTATSGVNGACTDGFGGVGAGSLQLNLDGNEAVNGTSEWAFWYQWAGGNDASYRFNGAFGTVSALSELSFDWFRTANAQSRNTTLAVDWADKTPVFRLRLWEGSEDIGGAGGFESELVWEGWYNQCSFAQHYAATSANCNDNDTPLNTWVRQGGMQADRFWYLRPPLSGGNGTTSINQGDCTFADVEVWDAAASPSTIADLFAGEGTPCLSRNAKVLGVAVGIGSRWPHAYEGFVDNVRLGFEGQNTLAVNTNFDVTTVPEPSTTALLAVGMFALGFAARRRAGNVRRDRTAD